MIAHVAREPRDLRSAVLALAPVLDRVDERSERNRVDRRADVGGNSTGTHVLDEDVARALEGRGRALASLGLDGFEIIPCLPTAIMDDVTAAADTVRGQYAYLLGIGDPRHNFYVSLATRLGFGDAVARIHDRVRRGDRAGAAAAVPLAFIRQTALVGPVDDVAERMRAYAAAGVTTLGIMVSAAATSTEGRLEVLRRAARALERSGVGGS